MTWHNTLAVPGHFHATVVLGTTLAFMGLSYYVLRLVFGREWVLKPLAVIQPYLYAGAMSITVLMMMYIGILFGVPRRHPSVMDIPGTDFSFAAAKPLFFIFGIAALVAILGGALFVVVAVGTLLGGDKYEGALPVERPTAVADGGPASDASGTSSDGQSDGSDDDEEGMAHHMLSMRGTFILALVFFAVFVVMMALNWFLLSGLWKIG
jgi:cytochrome c oxidase subunit 1